MNGSGGIKASVLNVVVSTPKNREGAVRAGLLLGDHLVEHVDIDTVKMEGCYDDLLSDELQLEHDFHTTPSRTGLRDALARIFHSSGNYENSVIWTELSTPRSLSTYDIAHIHNAVPLGGLLTTALRCKFAGVPYVMTTHGISKIPEWPQSMDMNTTQRLLFKHAFLRTYYLILQNAAHLFALSKNDKEALCNRFPGQSVSVIPNGVQIFSELPSTQTDLLERSENRSVLLFVGKLIKSKGIEDLLEAYQRVTVDCTLLIAGPSDSGNYLDRIAEFDENEVRYLGYVDHDTLISLYKQSDLFVFPTRSDVFPLVTLEAMAAGTPVVSTNVGGIPEQISEDTGILIDPGRPAELAAAIDQLLKDERRLASMSDDAKQRAKSEFSWNEVARKTAKMYQEIITPWT